MLLRDTLIAISDDARSWLTYFSRDFTADDARRSSGVVNPLAWQLGHLAVTEDYAYRMATGDTDVLVAKELHDTCGNACPAPTDATTYPPLEELWALLGRTHARVIALAQRSSDTDFDKESVTKNPFFRTVGQTIYELALHENYHVGQVGALRKGLGKPSLG